MDQNYSICLQWRAEQSRSLLPVAEITDVEAKLKSLVKMGNIVEEQFSFLFSYSLR